MNTQSYNFREAITPEVERTERYMRRGDSLKDLKTIGNFEKNIPMIGIKH